MKTCVLAFAAFVALVAGSPASGDGLEGRKTVYLADGAGQRLAIGAIDITATAPGRWKFAFTLDPVQFQEYFLAMRPFRCIQTPRRSLCAFPFGSRDEVSEKDWSALEYQLVFIHKPAASLSLDSRNGMYWKLHREGDRLLGSLYDADLEPIVVPGAERIRPLTEDYLQSADRASHPYPDLVIE